MDACIDEWNFLWSLHVHCPKMAEFPRILVQAVEEFAACYYVRNLQRNLLWTVCNIRATPIPVATFPSQHNLGVFSHFSSLVLETRSLESCVPPTPATSLPDICRPGTQVSDFRVYQMDLIYLAVSLSIAALVAFDAFYSDFHNHKMWMPSRFAWNTVAFMGVLAYMVGRETQKAKATTVQTIACVVAACLLRSGVVLAFPRIFAKPFGAGL
jgi:hypothetical protein